MTGEDRRQEIAEELLLLTVLKDRVAEEIERRKRGDLGVEGWTPGSKITVTLPNDANPNRPIKVGEVRLDGGQGIARVADREAWVAFNRANYAHNVVEQPESVTRWKLDPESILALDAAVDAAGDVFAADGKARAALDALEAAGYTLTKVERIPAAVVVLPAWEQEVLKQSQKAGEPVTPDGQIPDGIDVDTTDPRPYVSAVKHDDVRTRFVTEHAHQLAAITGQTDDADG